MTEHRIPGHVLDEVRRRTDLVAVAGALGVELTERGRGDFWGCCPFHEENTPSFHIVRTRGFYKCFGCQEAGGAIAFVQALEPTWSFPEAVAWLAQRAGVEVPGFDAPSRAPKPVVVRHDPEAEADDRATKRRKAYEKFWLPARPIAGTVAETYLAEARAIRHAVFKDLGCLRFLPEVPYWAKVAPDRWEIIHAGPALVTGMQTMTGGFAGAHVTFLQPDGGGKMVLWERPPNAAAGDPGELRPAKKIHGVMGPGVAMRLAPPAASMAVGEGLETALSCTAAGGPNAWGAGSLHAIAGHGRRDGKRDWHPLRTPDTGQRRKLPTTTPDMDRPAFLFPAGTREGLLLGDGDTQDPYMLEALLTRAERRFRQMGIHCMTVISPSGTDFNDLLRQGLPEGEKA